MKFALNGALTIGTLDGANIEIMDEVGRENIFIFGLTTEEVASLRSGYQPLDYYNGNSGLSRSSILSTTDSQPGRPRAVSALIDLLLHEDRYKVLADFDAYHRAQMDIDSLYCDTEEWTKKSILNVARIGKFSSDRTILEYNRDIWHAEPYPLRRNQIELQQSGTGEAKAEAAAPRQTRR